MIKLIRILVKIKIFKRIIQSLIKKIFYLFKIKNIIIKKDNILLALNLKNPIDRQIFFRNNYEAEQIEYLRKLIKRFDIKTFIDIGAHMGIYSTLISKENIKVFAFEPYKENYDQLKLNKKLNNLDNLNIYNCALSDKNKNIIMWVSDKEKTGGMSIFDKNDEELKKYNPNNITKIKSKSLIGDNVLDIIEEYIAIKIDVERHEYKVLKGLNKLLKKNYVVIQIELFDERRRDITKYLQELNFSKFNSIKKDSYFKNF
jgi:FkbM family methyltransferase|tara:strand:- start:4627 stop:5400 length:774 start_codon:yes stop_codon:yes gene_type:complete